MIQEVIFVGKIIAGILGILCCLVVILFIFITIKLIDYKHIMTAENEQLEDSDEEEEEIIDVGHLKQE